METLLLDIRYGLRTMRNNPGFTIVAVLTLALGIGVNSALFSVVNGVLLNPLHYDKPDELVAFYAKNTQFDKASISYPNFLDWQKDTRTFSSLAAYRSDDFTLTGVGEAERLHGHMISAGLFPMLGVRPLAGRSFLEEEDRAGANPVVILGDGLWKRKFAGASDVVGKTIALNGTIHTVVGVMPGRSPMFSPSDLYVPIGQWSDPTFRDRRVSMGMFATGRLKPGVTLIQARADMEAVAHNLAMAYPEADAGSSVVLLPLKQDIVGDIQPFLVVLLGAVGFVLLIACANVGNLLLARSTGRTREFAIRAAVGASQGRVLRQLLTESVLLALSGGVLGLLLARWGTQAVLAAMPAARPRADEVGFDERVLLFTLVISLAAGILFGLAPAWRTSNPNLHETLKEGGRGVSHGRHRTQHVFVAVEMALALVLLIGAGLMIRSMRALWSLDPGFDPSHVLAFSLTLSPQKTATPALIRESYRETLRRFEAVPGVESAALSGGSLPMRGDSELPFWREGQPKPATDSDMNWAVWYMATPEYWKTMRIPLLKGRLFTEQDNENSPPVAIIDQEFAQKFFGSEDPIGKRINLGLMDTQPEIVGIVGHVNHWGLGATGHDNLKAELYTSAMQLPDKFMPLVVRGGLGVAVRTSGEPSSFTSPLRRATTQFDSEAVLFSFQPMNEIVSDSIAAQRFSMILLAVFAGLALLLASVGIYGVISYFVGQRTQELGIRMALGARSADVLQLVLGQGTRMALIGVGVGLACALGLTRLMSSMLYGISAADPITFCAVALVLMMISALACYVPARRATKVDPMVALRYE